MNNPNHVAKRLSTHEAQISKLELDLATMRNALASLTVQVIGLVAVTKSQLDRIQALERTGLRATGRT